MSGSMRATCWLLGCMFASGGCFLYPDPSYIWAGVMSLGFTFASAVWRH